MSFSFQLKGVFLLVPVMLIPCSSLRSDDRMQFSSSQPDFAAGGCWEAMLKISQNEGQVSFSQPTKPEHMLLGSQLLGTPGASQVIHVLSATSICDFFIKYISQRVGIFSNMVSESVLQNSCHDFLILSCFSTQICFMKSYLFKMLILTFCVQSQWQRLVRRMTRFFTTANADVSLSSLKDACDGLSLCFKLTCTKQVNLCSSIRDSKIYRD